MRMHLRTFSRLFIAEAPLLSGSVLSRFGPRPGPVPFCQAFVRCCQATYCLCPPFCRHYLPTAKKLLFPHPLSAQGACPVCTGPDLKKKKIPQTVFDQDLSQGFLELARLSLELLDLVRGRLTRRVAGEPFLARLQELLRPTVVQVLIDPFLAAQLSNAVLATQALQHDADLLFSGMMPACGSANIPDCLFSALRYALLSGATMSQQSSLMQSAHSVRPVLTAYNGQPPSGPQVITSTVDDSA